MRLASARNVGGKRIPCFPVKRLRRDGIVWLAMGVSLFAQAGFLLATAWGTGSPSPHENERIAFAHGLVAAGFVATGAVALGLGVGRIRAARRERDRRRR